MNQDQIKQWAAEAKIDLEHQVSLSREPVWIATDDELTRFAALVAQHEREACALVCEMGNWKYSTPMKCAIAIRARGGGGRIQQTRRTAVRLSATQST